MKWRIDLLLFCFVTVFFLWTPRITSADIGIPTIYSQGGTLYSSDEATEINMEYEKVVIKYDEPKTLDGQSGEAREKWMNAHVVATFRFKNNGTAAEERMVYFPFGDQAFLYGLAEEKISNFRVDGVLLDETNKINVKLEEAYKEFPAYGWEVVFEPQQIEEITVEYDTRSGKNYEVFYLTYVLGTGHGWQGPIGEGEISFVLPFELPTYAIINELPQSRGLKEDLPYQFDGKKITINFSDYEPPEDKVITLGVYDINTVINIETLKREPETFENLLEIASLFKKLSLGTKCSFCTGQAAVEAREYYGKALDSANSEQQLNTVLESYGYYSKELLELMKTVQSCTDDDLACKYDIIYNQIGSPFEGLGSPFYFLDSTRGNSDTGRKDFLLHYASRMKIFNPEITEIIETYVENDAEVYQWKQQNSKLAETPDSELPNFVSRRWWLLLAIIPVIVIVLLRKMKYKPHTTEKENLHVIEDTSQGESVIKKEDNYDDQENSK